MGAFFAFIPLMAEDLGLGSRALPRRVRDRRRRAAALRGPPARSARAGGLAGTALVATSIGLLISAWPWHASSPPVEGLFLGTVVFAGVAFTMPAILAMAVIGVRPDERGAVVGTAGLFVDAAFGLSPAVLGFIATLTDYPRRSWFRGHRGARRGLPADPPAELRRPADWQPRPNRNGLTPGSIIRAGRRPGARRRSIYALVSAVAPMRRVIPAPLNRPHRSFDRWRGRIVSVECASRQECWLVEGVMDRTNRKRSFVATVTAFLLATSGLAAAPPPAEAVRTVPWRFYQMSLPNEAISGYQFQTSMKSWTFQCPAGYTAVSGGLTGGDAPNGIYRLLEYPTPWTARTTSRKRRIERNGDLAWSRLRLARRRWRHHDSHGRVRRTPMRIAPGILRLSEGSGTSVLSAGVDWSIGDTGKTIDFSSPITDGTNLFTGWYVAGYSPSAGVLGIELRCVDSSLFAGRTSPPTIARRLGRDTVPPTPPVSLDTES